MSFHWGQLFYLLSRKGEYCQWWCPWHGGNQKTQRFHPAKLFIFGGMKGWWEDVSALAFLPLLWFFKVQRLTKFVCSAIQQVGFVHLFIFRKPALIRINDQKLYNSFVTSCSRALNCEWMPVFLVHSIKTRMFNHSTHMFTCSITQLACSSLYLIVTGLLVCAQALTRAACIMNTLWVLIARYVFTRVCRMHYMTSSNSSVNVRIGNHICKGRVLILLMTRPARINYLSANYTEFYFC